MNMIYRTQEWYNDKGGCVREYITADGKIPDTLPKFVGVGMYELDIGDGHRIPQEYMVPIVATSLTEAFEKLSKTMKDALPEIEKQIKQKQQAQQNKIII
jgi:hypothetical protein